jgi:hypothetical protein
VPVDIGYKGHVSPSDVSISLSLEISGKTLYAKINNIGGFSVLLEPSGNIGSQILSGIAWPLAQTMVSLLTPMVSTMINGQKFSLMDITFSSIDVMGVRVNLSPAALSVSEHSGMFMVGGGVNIS